MAAATAFIGYELYEAAFAGVILALGKVSCSYPGQASDDICEISRCSGHVFVFVLLYLFLLAFFVSANTDLLIAMAVGAQGYYPIPGGGLYSTGEATAIADPYFEIDPNFFFRILATLWS